MPTLNTKNTGYQNAKLWRDAQYNSGESDPVLYVYIGNHVPYANELSPDSIVDTVDAAKDVWDNMYAAKKATANDVELVVPRINWTANSKYQQYDDTVDITTLLTANSTAAVEPMYVITTDRNVYKCMSNNVSANSTVEPSGDYTTSNGNIATADGYLWKYMYNVKPSNKFLTPSWIPAPYSTSQLDYGTSTTGVVEGELTTIVVTNSGSGYYNNIVTVSPFANSCTVLTLANTTNISANMAVTGTGIFSGTYISTVDTPNNKITISTATTANGGGSGNNITISTRVYIEGDGSGVEATSTLSSGNVANVTITVIGTGYSRANAFIYGSGTGATARPIISPKYGHAKNPAKELGASNLMTAIRVGEIDTTEGGIIPANTSFRQFGIMANPHKYGNTLPVTHTTANSVISQTTDLSLVAGSNFALDEYVYQGVSPSSATFSAHVIAQTSNQIRLTKVYGAVTVGLPLVGATSGVSRTVISTVSNPELEPYSGDILYAENAIKADRELGQAENIKLVIKF